VTIASKLTVGTRLPFGTVTEDPALVTSPDGREMVALTVEYSDGSCGRRMFGPGDDLPAVPPPTRTRIGVRGGRLVLL